MRQDLEPGAPPSPTTLNEHGDLTFLEWGVWKAWSYRSLKTAYFTNEGEALTWLKKQRE